MRLAELARAGDMPGIDLQAARILDLRSRAAFEQGHLPGASRIEMDEVGLPFLCPPRRRKIVLLADDPDVARRAGELMRAAGYDAVPIEDPVSEWTGAWEVGPERVPAWEPSRLVAAWADRPPAGSGAGSGGGVEACDLACGSGRDAVFLAMRGWAVTAFDLLPDALEQGRRLTERHGVTVRFVRADIERDPASWSGPWDLINVQRFLHRPSLGLFGTRLRPGGILLYETFLERQAREPGRKPRNPAFLLKDGELRAAAERQGLAVLEYREGRDDNGDWNASLAARRAVSPPHIEGVQSTQ